MHANLDELLKNGYNTLKRKKEEILNEKIKKKKPVKGGEKKKAFDMN